MRTRVAILAIAVAACAAATLVPKPTQRHFHFTYAFTIVNPEPGKPLSIWFPKAVSDRYQRVRVISANGDLPLKATEDAEYGNAIYYAHSQKANKPEYHFAVEYDVVRYERGGLVNGEPMPSKAAVRPAVARFLEPDKLVPTSGRLAGIAAQQAQGAGGQLQQARAIYNYVFANMRYDKTGTGWGRGDSEWACDAKHGNCTDFHSLFASMARSQGIPTRFAIGFSIPDNKQSGDIAGYHCWADFYVEGGWVPIDISEAWKAPAKKDYFFGHHDANRIQFSVGRDITLSPKQKGEALNYFVYPYVESAANRHENIRNEFSFGEVQSGVAEGKTAR